MIAYSNVFALSITTDSYQAVDNSFIPYLFWEKKKFSREHKKLPFSWIELSFHA